MSRRTKAGRRGHLFIIGGAEDRENDKRVLARLVELTGGSPGGIAVVTAASSQPEALWQTYDEAFRALGVKKRFDVAVATREEALDEARARTIYEADVVFMTGGDQKRLMSVIGGTRIDNAMHRAVRERGACIAGTSAGASAMSEHMLYEGGNRELLPVKGAVQIAAGLGLVRRVVIDQHFSERQRLGRLLSVVAQNPYLLGAGIDEDTALVIEPGRGLEVVGEGAVTVVDGRAMSSNFLESDADERLALANVRLHLLPAGSAYYFDRAAGEGAGVPGALHDVIAAFASTGDPSHSELPSTPYEFDHEDR
jgi:cyanophycinase